MSLKEVPPFESSSSVGSSSLSIGSSSSSVGSSSVSVSSPKFNSVSLPPSIDISSIGSSVSEDDKSPEGLGVVDKSDGLFSIPISTGGAIASGAGVIGAGVIGA